MSKLLIYMKLCLTSVCSHHNRPKNTVFAMENLDPGQEPHRFEAMPTNLPLVFFWLIFIYLLTY